MTPSQCLREWAEKDLVATFALHKAVNEKGHYLLNYDYHQNKTRDLTSSIIFSESAGSPYSWRTSSKRMCALGWRKWRELRYTPRQLPCWRWEPTSSANQLNRPANWQTLKPRWAHQETFEWAWDNLFASNQNEQLWGSQPCKKNPCHLRNTWRIAN